MESVNINTRYLDVLEGFFYDLSVINQRAVLTKAYRRASKPLAERAKQLAPQGEPRKIKGRYYAGGNLEKSIGIMLVPREIAVLVGARKGGGSKGWHGHLVESGTKERFRKNGGATGRVIGRKFFESAFEQTSEQVYGGIESEWYDELDKYITRVNRKL